MATTIIFSSRNIYNAYDHHLSPAAPIGSLCFKFGELSHGYTSLIAIPTLFHPSPGNVRFLFHVWLGVVGGCVTATQGRNTLVSSRHNTLLHQMGGFWTHNVIASGIHAVGCMTPLVFFICYHMATVSVVRVLGPTTRTERDVVFHFFLGSIY